MADERRFCRNCGQPVNSEAKFCRHCGQPLEGKPRKPGSSRLVIPVVLILAAAAFAVFGLLLKGKPKPPEVKTVSSENPEITTASGVSVKLSEYAIDGESDLSVRPVDPVTAENGDYLIRPYEVNLGDIHELADFIEIRIPYDASFTDKGEDPAECVGGVYYNQASGEWEETLYSVDAKKGEVVILTDHLSTFGAMTVRNKGKRSAYLTSIETEDDFSVIAEDKAVAVMRQLITTQGSDRSNAKLVGNEVLQAALSLGGAVSTLSDTAGNAFNLACFLDISDLAMQGKYVEQGLVIFPHHARYATVSYSNNMFQTYNRGLTDRAGSILSNVGITVSGCKLAAMVGKAAAGKADQAEILGMYKDAASLAVSIGGSATLGALMGPVWLADQFFNACFEEGMQIKQDQMAEMYTFFNTKYEGSQELNIRPGRSLKDWRKRIIELIDENPDGDSARILQDEIDDFAGDFWRLLAVEIDNVAASAPKTYRRIPFDDAKLRKTLTDDYKKQLYLELVPVMTSVRNYYDRKMVRAAKESVINARKFYNQKIDFSIIEPLEEGEKPKYAGCKVVFAPLKADADLSSWSSVIPASGGELYGDFSLIGHITAGSPNTLLVFDKDADIAQDEPLLAVPAEIIDNSCRILLEDKEEKLPDIASFTGTWYDNFGAYEEVKDFGDGIIGHSFYLGMSGWLKWKYSAGPDPYTLLLSDPTHEILDNWESGTDNRMTLSKDGQTLVIRYNGQDRSPLTRNNSSEEWHEP